MAILSSSTLIRLHGCILVTSALTFVFFPDFIQSSTLVWVLGEALQLPETTPVPAASSQTSSSFSSSSITPPSLANMTAFVLILLALSHVFFAPQEILPPSKYNVVSFSVSQWLNRTWQTLSAVFGGFCLILDAAIYLIASAPSESKDGGLGTLAEIIGDRTLFATCFVEFLFWFYAYSVLKEEFMELAGVGKLRGEDWGILGQRDDKIRVD